MSQTPTVECPTCGAPVEWTPESKFRPFCSDRCKLIDLGAWASEEHARFRWRTATAEDELFEVFGRDFDCHALIDTALSGE
jgi:endogenous inhibitor of DNA gyrase (YacG/DUF329 family)